MTRIKSLSMSTVAVFGVVCSALATFDYPGTGILSTRAQKINDTGDIVGDYFDSNGVYRSFVRFSNGNFSAPIVDPNDTCNFTAGRGINNSRLVCGDYYYGNCTPATAHGYFLMRNNFSQFDVPGSVSTVVLGVNNAGDFAGGFVDAAGTSQAFVSIGETITPFSVPGATLTAAYQLNSSNQTEGHYIDSSGIFHGYVRDTNGALHFPIDPSGSIETELFGNNDSNWIVGRYQDSAGTTHGLFFVPPNRFFSFDYPGSTFTSFNGINAQGFICGRYLDASGIEHGILARVRVSVSANDAGTEMKADYSRSFIAPMSAQLELSKPAAQTVLNNQ